MMNRAAIVGLAAVIVAIVVAFATLFTVDQTEQVLVTQFGKPVRVIDKPGLHARIPFVQTVIPFDRRLLNYELPGEEVILAGQRRLIVDSFTCSASPTRCATTRRSARAWPASGRG